jgi:hypothetical protein
MINQSKSLCRATRPTDAAGFQKLTAFLSLSRNGKGVVSNEIKHDDGTRRLLVYVNLRKVDDGLAMAGVLLSEGRMREICMSGSMRGVVETELRLRH